MKVFILMFIMLCHTPLFAFEQITNNTDPVIVYQVDESYEDSIEYIKSGIADEGLKITNDLHIGDMLAGTAADTGLKNPYAHATALEFCSISMAHVMAMAHPANMSACPLTLNIYQSLGDDQVYVAFKRPGLLGDAKKATEMVIKLMDGIVRGALE